MKQTKWIFWISTGLLTAMMLLSAGMYLFNTEEVSKVYQSLGFPTFIIYPLAIAKILGLVAIWTGKVKWLKEWAYAGFFFDFLLAFGAHLNVNDGEFIPALVAMALLLTSYFTGKKLEDTIASNSSIEDHLIES